jgi:hypothetical protein
MMLCVMAWLTGELMRLRRMHDACGHPASPAVRQGRYQSDKLAKQGHNIAKQSVKTERQMTQMAFCCRCLQAADLFRTQQESFSPKNRWWVGLKPDRFLKSEPSPYA